MSENPHLEHGIGIAGLCHNLQCHPPEWAGAIFTGAYEPLRLAAIARQAQNVKDDALLGVCTIGTLLAAAAQSGRLSPADMESAGRLVEFLGVLAGHMDILGCNAAHSRDHGPLV